MVAYTPILKSVLQYFTSYTCREFSVEDQLLL